MRMDVALVVLRYRLGRNGLVTEPGQCKGDSNANKAGCRKALAAKSTNAGHNMSKAYVSHVCFSPVSIPTKPMQLYESLSYVDDKIILILFVPIKCM